MEPQITTEQTAPIATPMTEPTPTPRKKISRVHLALIAGVIAGLALGYFFFVRANVDVAAVVNGTKITQAKVNENIDMMKKSAELQGIDVNDPVVATEIQTQALENLINNELLLGAARESGVTANEAAIQSAYETLVSEVGGEEVLKSRMETVGLTSDTLMGNISDRLMVDQYIESVTDIETVAVSDEEIATYLESITTEGVTLPPLEEIKPQIESTILAQKQQGIVDDLLAQLRSEATIEIKE
jgi:hypothetical protein